MTSTLDKPTQGIDPANPAPPSTAILAEADRSAFVHAVDRLVASSGFQYAVLWLIVAAAVVVGVETYPSIMDQYGPTIYAIDWTILSLFIVEALLKMLRHGKRWYRYFHDPWNIFDFTIIVVCLLPLDGHYAAVLRLARVLRALRMVSALPKLQLLVNSLLRSLPSMGYVCLLLVLLFYMYAVMGVALFHENDPVHFGNLQLAMLSLFRVVTLEDWTDIMYIQMWGSDVYSIEGAVESAPKPQAFPIVGAFYFVSFVILGTMIMLNLVIGVIINSMQEAHDEQVKSEPLPDNADTARTLAHMENELNKLQVDLRRLRKAMKG